jgi:hypothetical protein
MARIPDESYLPDFPTSWVGNLPITNKWPGETVATIEGTSVQEALETFFDKRGMVYSDTRIHAINVTRKSAY